MDLKEKYKKLMDEKIQIERERNRLFEIAKKLLSLLQENGIEANLPELRGVRSQSGISLIPGDCEVTTLNYNPFRNDF